MKTIRLPVPLIALKIDAAVIIQKHALFGQQVSLLVPAGYQTAAMVDNTVAGIDAVIFRTAQNFSDQSGIFASSD